MSFQKSSLFGFQGAMGIMKFTALAKYGQGCFYLFGAANDIRRL